MESTLRKAADAYQERKVEFLGRLYASLLFGPGDAADAHYLLETAERLTWRQLLCLAFFEQHEYADSFHLFEDASRVGGRVVFPDHALFAAELEELATQKLLGVRQPDGGVTAVADTWGPGPIADMESHRLSLMPLGQLLYSAMELSEVAPAELEEIRVELRGTVSPSASRTARFDDN